MSIKIWFFSFFDSLIATGLAISVEEMVDCLKKLAIPAIPVGGLIIGGALKKRNFKNSIIIIIIFFWKKTWF